MASIGLSVTTTTPLSAAPGDGRLGTHPPPSANSVLASHDFHILAKPGKLFLAVPVIDGAGATGHPVPQGRRMIARSLGICEEISRLYRTLSSPGRALA